jgi:hypothetical protein
MGSDTFARAGTVPGVPLVGLAGPFSPGPLVLMLLLQTVRKVKEPVVVLLAAVAGLLLYS